MRKSKISAQDPLKLIKKNEPGNMSEAIVAKCHAYNQLVLIDDELKALRKLKRDWTKRWQQCMRVMEREAIRAAPKIAR
jgi:hypothetical protein